MHRRWESVTWGFTGNAGRKSPKLPRKPPFFAPRDLPYIVRFCVFAPNFRQDAPWKALRGEPPPSTPIMSGQNVRRVD